MASAAKRRRHQFLFFRSLLSSLGPGVMCTSREGSTTLKRCHSPFDYKKPVGHLVIVNLSALRSPLPSDAGPTQPPPRIVTEGVTIFMIDVHGKPRPSASKEKPVTTVVITREQLLVEVAS